MDVETLNAGQEFEELPDTYTIFITKNDIFGYGEGVYRIERVILGEERLFGDRQHILYVNGTYRGDDPLGELMHDFCCHDPDDMKVAMMAESTRFWKENPKGVEIMCKVMEDMRNEAMEKGIEKGIDLLGSLMTKLKSLGREDDAFRAAADSAYRAKLFQEFQMVQ